ncbi:helix-turn-helix domain-containing protein [Caulobacter soli]|uniref:helix-turn-helix domain-containing protein n=1 Tax=Caulobacter soli TaxID=2708539 RepID=UPI0013EAAF21|nr:AraC family transcriptional regulator [Caulobacter soli]
MIVRSVAEKDVAELASLFIAPPNPGKWKVAAAEIRLPEPLLDVTPVAPRADVLIVRMQLNDYPRHRYWEDGMTTPVRDVAAGEILFHDLRRGPRMVLDQPYHALHVHIPRAAFDAIAADSNAAPIRDFDYAPGVGFDDPTIAGLGTSILAGLGDSAVRNQPLVDHLILAMAAHVATRYGGMAPMSRGARGGLAPWQTRRAKEILSANLDGAVPLTEVARQCGLSVGHFSRSFRQSFGTTPHQWLVQRRLDAAKDLIRSCRMPLSNVALSCGFADQSHLTRVFTREVGASPAAWRREVQQ